MPRVPPIASKADVAPEHQAVVDDVLKVFGAVRGPFSMMLHSPEMTKRMLPLVATLVMGAMSRQAAPGAGSTQLASAGAGGLLEMLGGALDRNQDGSPLDDILGTLGRTFGRT